jgi:membrane protein implicated in regulation of membrane protease activity
VDRADTEPFVTIFFVVGIVGLVLLLATLVLGDLFDSLFDSFDLEAGGFISGPAIGAFLASFGFGAALIQSNSDWSTGASAVGGLAIGAVIGAIVGAVTRTLMHMPTDATLRATDLVGAHGTVVTRIPVDGMGEITLVQSGQLMKLAARADGTLQEGTSVVVVGVLSSTSVKVRPSDG